jgi:hypothetical protein
MAAGMTAARAVQDQSTRPIGALTSWHAGPARDAVIEFVARVRSDGGAPPVPVEQRVAVFDNGGTLGREQPMPIQLDFNLRRLVEMADADPTLRDRQPWKAACERDGAWLNSVITDHYTGDDRKVKTMMAGVLAAYDGISVEDFDARAETFLRIAVHTTRDRPYDGPQKPIRIWSRTGRRPLLAAGSANGDAAMLDFAQRRDQPFLQLLGRHHDAVREFSLIPPGRGAAGR